jgi:ornithine cyclodeaminase
MSADGLRIVGPAEVAAVADLALAWRASTGAFAAVADGAATVPSPMALEMPDAEGEVHVKGAWLRGRPTWTVKVATGFYGGAGPSGGGLAVCGSARDGRLLAVLDDRGLLTDLRTAAAGALATDLLARADATRLAVLGAGTQARLHVAALLAVRPLSAVTVWARRPEAAAGLARALAEAHGLATEVASSPAAAVADADTVICATPSRAPLLDLADVRPGTHVTALGSDAPGKRELSSRLVAGAAVVVADDLAQARALGELQHAAPRRTATLGALLLGDAGGRTAEADVTLADLTGIGAQDAALAERVLARLGLLASGAPASSAAIRPARADDLPALRRLARRAYARYVARIGARPGPMDAERGPAVAEGRVHVVDGPPLLGAIVLAPYADHLEVTEVTVDPAVQGAGLGRRLLAHAEGVAARAGLAQVRLDTNARMAESLALYGRLGYATGHRARRDGLERVFLHKAIGARPP